MVFKVIPLLANDSEGTLLRNSLLPGSGAIMTTVKRCKISNLIAWFVVWVALYLSDIIVSLFWLEYDPGNLHDFKKKKEKTVCGLRTGVSMIVALRTADCPVVCLETIPFVSPNKIKCPQHVCCTHKIIH